MRTRNALIVASALVASLALAVQDGILLRRDLKENSTEKYKIETKTNQTVELPNGMGDQEVEITMGVTYVLNLGKADEATGEVAVETVTTVDKMESNAPMGQPPKIDPVKMPGKLDSRNRVKFDPVVNPSPMMAMMNSASSMNSFGLFVEFPEKAVKVGDSWVVVVPKNPMIYKEDQKVTATLVGEKKVDDQDVWIVTLAGKLLNEIDVSEMMKAMPTDQPNPLANMKMTINGTMNLKGEGVVDKATGRTIRMKTIIDAQQKIEVADMGMTMNTVGKTTVWVAMEK